MKKVIATIAVVLTVGFVGINAVGAHMGWSGMYSANTTVTGKEASEARNKFYTETNDVRKEIAVKTAELFVLENKKDADPGKIETLRNALLDLQKELQKKAVESGIASGGWMHGWGHGMMMDYGNRYAGCWNGPAGN